VRTKLAANAAGDYMEIDPHSELDSFFDAESAILRSKRDKSYSFTMPSESEITI